MEMLIFFSASYILQHLRAPQPQFGCFPSLPSFLNDRSGLFCLPALCFSFLLRSFCFCITPSCSTFFAFSLDNNSSSVTTFGTTSTSLRLESQFQCVCVKGFWNFGFTCFCQLCHRILPFWFQRDTMWSSYGVRTAGALLQPEMRASVLAREREKRVWDQRPPTSPGVYKNHQVLETSWGTITSNQNRCPLLYWSPFGASENDIKKGKKKHRKTHTHTLLPFPFSYVQLQRLARSLKRGDENATESGAA